jgi:hypothetical protein
VITANQVAALATYSEAVRERKRLEIMAADLDARVEQLQLERHNCDMKLTQLRERARDALKALEDIL